MKQRLSLLLLSFVLYNGAIGMPASNEEEAKKYLDEDVEKRYSQACHLNQEATWNYMTNVTDETKAESVRSANDFAKFQAQIQKEINTRFSNWKEFQEPSIRRQFQYLVTSGPGNMPQERVDAMNSLEKEMGSNYAKAKVPHMTDKSKLLSLEPDLVEILKTEKDYDKLAYYWTGWHDVMSKAVPSNVYTEYVTYLTEYSKANNYDSMTKLWNEPYDTGEEGWTSDTFRKDMQRIWEGLKPTYSVLHGYVRMKLRASSPKLAQKIKKYGFIPAHLLGNMWGQEKDWSGLDNLTKPYPGAPSLDSTKAMLEKGYTAKKIFEESDKFFTGMGLPKMTDIFWKRSMLTKPEGREVVCHASAEDSCLGKGNQDYRIKQCTTVTHQQLITAHHEMGHINYFMQYSDQNMIFRGGANPGFHEAIGDALALAVTTPKHLQCALQLNMGLNIDCNDNKKGGGTKYKITEMDYNFLYRMALSKFAFFPFAISMDTWRWEVFDGTTKPEDYNKRWWELRIKNQGIVPPIPRPDNEFDPAAKFHIPSNVEYIRYFISHILQFAFYESMCIAAGEYNPKDPNSKPLFQCDFAGNKAAGKKLSDMMKMGFSKPWPEALEAITGNKQLSVKPLLNYFDPLFKKLKEDLKAKNEPACFGDGCENIAREYLEKHYEEKASYWCGKTANANWDQYTDTENAEKEKNSITVNLASSDWVNNEWRKNFSQFEFKYFKDINIKRQYISMNMVGTAALSKERLEEFNKAQLEMTKIYGQGKACPYAKKDNCDLKTEGLALTPDLEDILAKGEDYDEMAYVWKAWRDASGKKMKNAFAKYIAISNEGAVANDFKNMGDFWIYDYESPTFRNEMEDLWKELKEFYQELHAYFRFRLSQKFPQIKLDEPMPAHVSGNMWMQSWENAYKHVVPFPDSPGFDITETLQKKFTQDHDGVYKMFKLANSFFTGLGMYDMTSSFEGKAVIVKPPDRNVICHPSAWDFCDKKDWRIKMCTKVTHEDLIVVHHELGHIQYDMNYKDHTLSYRGGANPGFHEAIGDVIALSVNTPKHLKKLGFLPADFQMSEESTINYLLLQALKKVAFLPFGFLIDSYRWKIFDGTITPDKYNYHWLKMVNEYQGIVPPFSRSEEDFDAAAKYHLPSGTPYIRYFFANLLQFQVHRALCKIAGEYPQGPLHDCDVNENKAAGEKFLQILKAGSSKKWQDLLQETIGEGFLSASAIIEYFKPLQDFMKAERTKHNYPIGWDNNFFEKLYVAS